MRDTLVRPYTAYQDSPEVITSEPKLRGSASVTVYKVPIPATVMWVDNPICNDFVCEWCIRKQELAMGVISKSEYYEWIIQWLPSSDMNGRREPPKRRRKKANKRQIDAEQPPANIKMDVGKGLLFIHFPSVVPGDCPFV